MKHTLCAALAASLLMTGAAFAEPQTPTNDTNATRPGVEVTPPLEAAPPADPSSTTTGTTIGPARVIPPSQNAATSSPDGGPVLSDAEAKAWVNKVVYSSDNKNLGEVAEFVRDAGGKVTEMHADIGGFLGLGEQRVKLMPSEFTLAGDKVVLSVTADQAKALPKLTKS